MEESLGKTQSFSDGVLVLSHCLFLTNLLDFKAHINNRMNLFESLEGISGHFEHYERLFDFKFCTLSNGHYIYS